METFTIEQLGLFITLLAGACGGLLAIIIKSRCDKIDCLCLHIHRKPLDLNNDANLTISKRQLTEPEPQPEV